MINSEKKKIVSLSFYPFSKQFLEKMLDKFGYEEYDLIYFENISNYRMYIQEVIKFIKSLSGEKITFVSFGFLSNPAIQILVEYKDKIEKAIFIEPDISGILKNHNFIKHFFGYRVRDLIDFFVKDINISKKAISKNKKFFSTIKMDLFVDFLKDSEIYSNKSKLIDLIKTNVSCVFLWNKMFLDSWPLPQILTEDFDIRVFQINDNIYDFIINNNKFDIEIN